MTHRYLPRLFGGPLDGDVRVLDSETRRRGHLVVPVKGALRARPIEDAFRPAMGSSYTEAVYRRHNMAPGAGSTPVEVWAHESLPTVELYQRVWTHLLDRAGASYA